MLQFPLSRCSSLFNVASYSALTTSGSVFAFLSDKFLFIIKPVVRSNDYVVDDITSKIFVFLCIVELFLT